MDGHKKQKEQSRRMIETALFSLMEEKEYARITISEIAERADVARRTFYRLYDSREAVLDRYFQRLCRRYCEQHLPLENYHLERIAEEYFSFWYTYRKILLLFHKCGLDFLIYSHITQAAEMVVSARAGEKAALARTGETGKIGRYFPAYSAGGFANLLLLWINDGMREKPDEFARNVSREILQIL